MSAPLLTLPPLPAVSRTLSDAQAAEVRRLSAVPTDHRRCVTCGGRGEFLWYAPLNQRREVGRYGCACRDQYELHMQLAYRGVGTAYQRLTWIDGVGIPTPSRDRVVEYRQDFAANVKAGLGLVLSGATQGVGKTMCLALLVKEAFAVGVSAQMISFTDLLTAYTDSFQDAGRDRWLRILNTRLIGLDEVGREYAGRQITEVALESFLRHRTQQGLALLLSTNMTTQKMADSYGDHVVALLSETCETIDFSGVSYRPTALQRMRSEVKANLTRPVVVS